MTGQRLDLLVKLERDIAETSVPLADLLRTCVALCGRTGSTRLSEWVTNELKGYPAGAVVPAYRILAAPILIKTYIMSTGKTEKDIERDHGHSLVLRGAIDQLVAMSAHSAAKGKPFRLSVDDNIFEHRAGQLNKVYLALDPELLLKVGALVESMEWLIDPPLIQGVLGQVRTALAEFIAELRAEAGDRDGLPSSSQTDRALQAALAATVFANSNVTIMATSKGDIMPDGDRIIIRDNKTVVKGSSGNVSAASANVTQVNREAIDIAKIREFAALVHQISPTLGFGLSVEAELQEVTDDLTVAADPSAPKVSQIHRLLDKIVRLLRTVGPSAARNLAISMGDELIREIGSAVIKDLPH